VPRHAWMCELLHPFQMSRHMSGNRSRPPWAGTQGERLVAAEMARRDSLGPNVVVCQTDLLPRERGDVGQEVVGNYRPWAVRAVNVMMRRRWHRFRLASRALW